MQKAATLTDIGVRKLDSGQMIVIKQMALGDGNGELIVPNPAQTGLTNEFGRQSVQEGNTFESWLNVIAYVDSRFAGETIREFGLYDEDGDMIVYSSYPETQVPPVIDATQYIQIEIECYLEFHNASSVTIAVTPIYPQATVLERGIAKIASQNEVDVGLDDEKIVTPKKLKSIQDKITEIAENNVSVLSGTIFDGRTIPVPEGFTRSDCAHVVSMLLHSQYYFHQEVFSAHCSVDAYGHVTATTTTSRGESVITTSVMANYLVIAVKKRVIK